MFQNDDSTCEDMLSNADHTDATANCKQFSHLCNAKNEFGERVTAQCPVTCGTCGFNDDTG